MGADTDFNALYRELGVAADCDIVHFRQAYRRRVATLHPDHRGADDGLVQLQQLNQSYAQAVEFHRHQGRLPGAARVESVRAALASTPDVMGQPPTLAGKPGLTRYSFLVALVGAMLFWLHESNSVGPLVSVGMDSSDVRTIQGQPSSIDEPRWEYGSSWIEFRCGKVVDWYSAPGHPLRVDDDPALGGKPVSSDLAFDC